MKQYNAQYYIDKFSVIPDDKWGRFTLTDSKNRHCALGHCDPIYYPESGANIESTSLKRLFNTNLNKNVTPINDSKIYPYCQETPKERILAALEDIKIKEEEDRAIEIVNNIIKEEKLELV